MKKHISFILVISIIISSVGALCPFVTVCAAPESESGNNQIYFEDFENGTSGWTESGNIKNKYTVATLPSRDGTKALHITDDVKDVALAYSYTKFDVEPDVTYTVISDCLKISGAGIKIFFKMFDKADKQIFNQSVAEPLTVRTWQTISAQFTAPANAVKGQIFIAGTSSSVGVTYLDNIRVYKGTVEAEADFKEINQKLMKETSFDVQNVYEMPDFKPTIGHPRVYFNKDDIETIKANASHPQNKSAFERLKTEIKNTSSGKLSSTTGDNLSDSLMGYIQAKAFYYAIWGDEAKGKEAVSMLNNFLENANPAGSEYNSQGYLVFTIAAVYDWCYPLLTETDKIYFQNMGIITASTMEIGFPPTKGSVLNGHGAEAMLLRDQMAFALAVYDERPDIYQNIAGRYFEESIDSVKFLAEAKSSMFGNSYSTYRFQWEAINLFIMDAVGLPNIFGDSHKEILYWNLYARRPDSSEIRDGDSVSNNQNPWYYDERGTKSFFVAGNYYKDPYLKGEALRQNNGLIIGQNTGNQVLSSIEVLCFNDPSVGYKSVRELPLSRYYPSPRGEMIARTSWAEGVDSPAVIAQMKVDEYWTQGHDHLDSGEFEIYYKGALANDTGYYQAGRDGDTKENSGNTVYGTVHFYNYHRRTIAHNCMLVFDPNEDVTKSYRGYSNDGGQIFANNENSLTSSHDIKDENSRVAMVLGREFGPDLNQPDYTYLKGDLAKAYGDKVSEYERSFMFLNLNNTDTPAAMIVFDRVKAQNKTFDKKWVLHGLFKPDINGTRTVFKDTREGYNGKLTVDTLLPKADNLKITTVGSEDKDYTGSDNKKYLAQSFVVNGTDYWAQALTGKLNEGGGYRIEVSPEKDAEEDYFLNVLQVADADSSESPLTSEIIEATTHTGVKIADRVVMFGKLKDRVSKEFSFTVTGDGSYKYTVADLKEGTWQVLKDGDEYAEIVVTKDGGVGSFDASTGTFTFNYLGSYGDKLFSSFAMPETEGINIKLPKENKYVYAGGEPYTKDGHIMVTADSLYRSLGAKATWNRGNMTLTATIDGKTIKMYGNTSTAIINDTYVTLDAPTVIKNNKLMAPLKFVVESLGYRIDWDEFSKTAVLNKATITYDEEKSRISVSSTAPGTLYIATYENKKLTKISKYTLAANSNNRTYTFKKGQAAYIWDENMQPMCEEFKLE